MFLEELKEQAFKLSMHDRLSLIGALIQSLQTDPSADPWQYLVTRPHPWRRQLSVKGRKLLASTVWQDMLTNGMSIEQTAENWDLPLPAIHEIILYCER
nr:hypothetical protein [Oculatellaceae cyanobacterium Prado106]